MSPILNQEDLILDNDRKVMPGGKILCLDPVSNNEVEISTYDSSDDTYVPADNPIYLNSLSRVPNTYFANQLVLCRLYKYLGNFSDPMIDDDTENWEFVRDFYSGQPVDSNFKNDSVVYGLSGLLTANPELGCVDVVGYWNESDCERRSYVWDPTSVASADGGYIVKNPDIDTGRWILKFDGEYIPSTYYGVYPGREANINALLGYVDSIGTQKTAPGVYFVRGNYDASTSPISTSKKIMVDAGTTFTRSLITCSDVKVIGRPSTPIGEFYFPTPIDTPVHSTWFKTAQNFLTCNSKHLVFDSGTSFADSTITTTVTLQDCLIEAYERLPITYASGQCLTLIGCDIIGDRLFNVSNDYVKFQNMSITDRWWVSSNISNWSIGTINNGNHIEAKTSAMNDLSIHNFNSANIFLKFMAANGTTDVNLEGATLTKFDADLSASSFTTLRNCRISGNMNLYGNITLYNVQVDGYVDTSTAPNEGVSITAYNSRLYFYNDLKPVWLTAYNSKVYTYNIFTANKLQLNLTDCDDVSVSLNYATNNTAITKVQTFKNCHLRNCTFGLKEAHFYDCYIEGGTYKFYPYKTGNDFYLKTTFSGCTINMSNPIEYTKFYGGTDGDSCYEMWSQNKWVGNNFCGSNVDGITMPLWAVPASEKLFLKPGNHTNHLCNGNVGRCPKESPAGYYLASWSDGTIYGRQDHPAVKKMNLSMRAFPDLSSGYNGTFINKFIRYACPIDPNGGYSFTSFGIFSLSSNGDLFSIGLYSSSYTGDVKIA